MEDLQVIAPKECQEQKEETQLRNYEQTHIKYESVQTQFEQIQKQYQLDRQLEELGIQGRQKECIKNNILDEMINETIHLVVDKEMNGGPELKQLDIYKIITQQIKDYQESMDQSQDDYEGEFNFFY